MKKIEMGEMVRLLQQGNPDIFPDGRPNRFTLESSEKHNGLTFYRMKELVGSLFLRQSFELI